MWVTNLILKKITNAFIVGFWFKILILTSLCFLLTWLYISIIIIVIVIVLLFKKGLCSHFSYNSQKEEVVILVSKHITICFSGCSHFWSAKIVRSKPASCIDLKKNGQWCWYKLAIYAESRFCSFFHMVATRSHL